MHFLSFSVSHYYLLTSFVMKDTYAKYVKEYYLGSSGVTVQTYNQKHLKNTAITDQSADRLWWFQVCTEVAYFQVAPSNDSIRSSKVDTRYVFQQYISLHVFNHTLLLYVNTFYSLSYGIFRLSFQVLSYSTNGCSYVTDIIWTFARMCLERAYILMLIQQTYTMEEQKLLVWA